LGVKRWFLWAGARVERREEEEEERGGVGQFSASLALHTPHKTLGAALRPILDRTT
jgi:hypothetical protein